MAEDWRASGVTVTLTEWLALPNTVRQATNLVRVWHSERENDANEAGIAKAKREASNR